MTRLLYWFILLGLVLPSIVIAKKNPIDLEGETLTFVACTRDILEYKKEGFVVQDFYLNGRKITSPYLIRDLSDVLNGDCTPHIARQKIFYSKYSRIVPSIQGELTEYYETGNVWKKSQYNEWSNGREEIYYDKENQKRLIVTYTAQDRVNSLGSFLDDDGKVSSEGPYINGEREGEWFYYYPGTKKLMMMRTYDKNRVTGPFTIWWENGNKQQEGIYLLGEKTGPITYWTETGTKASKVNYIKGVREGKYQAWYSNGRVRAEGYYHSGLRFGLWIFWFKNGQRQAEGYFERNEIPGKKWYIWSSDGRLLTSRVHTGKQIFQNFPNSLEVAKAGRFEDPYVIKDVEYRLNYQALIIENTPAEEQKRKHLEEFLRGRIE